MQQTSSNVETVLNVLKSASQSGYIGEAVSQLEHALQCAYFAARANALNEEVIACLLHDIGHICPGHQDLPKMDDWGVKDHESLGADFLKNLGFSDNVCELVRSHVDAKRYLCWKNRKYFDGLSTASLETLKRQGGKMDDNEALHLEAHPLFKSILKVRSFDEKGKIAGLKVPNLESYRSLIVFHLSQTCPHPQ